MDFNNRSLTNVHTDALEASVERTSMLREVLSAKEPEPTAESRVPTSSSSFSRAFGKHTIDQNQHDNTEKYASNVTP